MLILKICGCLFVDGKKCNEELISKCYQQYNGSATPICPEVKKLRICISELVGCHAMKHPKFVHLSDVLEKHRRCFFVNYSRILEVLKTRGNGLEDDINIDLAYSGFRLTVEKLKPSQLSSQSQVHANYHFQPSMKWRGICRVIYVFHCQVTVLALGAKLLR